MAALVAICVMSYWVRKVPGEEMVKKATSRASTAKVHASLTAATRLAHSGTVTRRAVAGASVRLSSSAVFVFGVLVVFVVEVFDFVFGDTSAFTRLRPSVRRAGRVRPWR